MGIHFAFNLDFHPHIEHITYKALKTLGFIKQIFLDFKLSSFKGLYYSLIRPIVEYGLILETQTPNLSHPNLKELGVNFSFLFPSPLKLSINHIINPLSHAT